jgi:hypothetical protein
MARETGSEVPEHVGVLQPFVSDFAFVGPRLMDYDAFFRGVHKIAPLELVRDKTATTSALQLLKRQLAIQNPSHLNLGFAGFEFEVGGRLRDGTPIIDWRNLPSDRRVTGELRFRFADAVNASRFAVSVPVVYSLGKIQEGRFALDWLQSSTVGQQLVNPKPGIVFPKLRKLGFWKGLSLMDVQSATSYLQNKLDSMNTETVSFFGISVNKAVALWAGPLVCLMIEWLILLHFKHLSALADVNAIARDYPWIALFPGRLNGLTTYSSLLILPVTTNVLLLFRYGHTGEVSTQFGGAFALVTAFLGLWIVRQVWVLRRPMSISSC